MVGRLPRKVLCGTRFSGVFSSRSWSGVLPTIRASAWAKKLEASIFWCLLLSIGL